MRFKVMFTIAGIFLALAGIALTIFSYSRLASSANDDYGIIMSFVGPFGIFFLGWLASAVQKVEASETRGDFLLIYGTCFFLFGGISMFAGFVSFGTLLPPNLFIGLGAVLLLFGLILIVLSEKVRARRV